MIYFLFLAIAALYNWRTFYRERDNFFRSVIEAKTINHREMILGHHFYIFVLESFIGLIVAHLISEQSFELGILSLGVVYILLLFWGFLVYQIFLFYIERTTGIFLRDSFKQHLVKEMRINFSLVFLPILIYSLINLTFQDSVFKDWGSLWFIGLTFNILFVSVLTITCTAIIMLKLIPNREITEEKYLKIIHSRLQQAGIPELRLRWIEADVKNAFVVGLKLLRFTNHTLFIGRELRTMLTDSEFDAVICHELSHVANRHNSKRLIEFIKNFISIIIGAIFIVFFILGMAFLFWGEESIVHTGSIAILSVFFTFFWFIFNYALLFDTFRSHEFESDGFAVIKLGVNFDDWMNALKKLTDNSHLPEYLKSKKNIDEPNYFLKKFKMLFSTHPKLEERADLLKFKIEKGLSYNYYFSHTQKMRLFFGYVFQLKIALPVLGVSFLSLIWFALNIKTGQDLITWVSSATREEMLLREDLVEDINTSPLILGPKLLFYVVKKEDPKLIDHYISRGADKAKLLLYLSEIKNISLFQKYFKKFGASISDDEYFLILRKSAQIDFVDGYRFLVNDQRFEKLDSGYKENVSKIIQLKRMPAQIKN